MPTIATIISTVKKAVWKTHPRCGVCGTWTKADGICHNPRCDHHGRQTAVIGASSATSGNNTHKAQQNLPKVWRPAVRTAAVNLARNNKITLPDGTVLAWQPEAKNFTLDGVVVKAASGGEAVRAAYARLAEPARKFQDAIAAFQPDLTLTGNPIPAYRQLRQDAAELHALAREAGVSLNPGPGFCADIRIDLVRQAKLALEKLPTEALRQISYAAGFSFPTLTQDPKATGKPSALVYWLNPVYQPGTAEVVQDKAMSRWHNLPESEQVETLVNEAKLHRALDQAGYSAPSPVVKYAGLTPAAAIVETRLAGLYTRIEKAAWKLARQCGSDQNDVAAEMRLAILEKGEQDPGFLLQTDAYILTHGVWAVKHRARNERHIQPEALHNGLEAPGFNNEIEVVPDTAAILVSLPAELRQVVELMLSSPADYLVGTGKINKTRLAEALGMSWWAANVRLQQIRTIVGSAVAAPSSLTV